MSVLILFMAVFALAPGAAAETLHIVTLELPPYGYTENQAPKGLTFELSNRIAQEAGFEPDNRIVPLARGVEEIAEGTADLIIMIPNAQIEARAINLGEILPTKTIVLGRAGEPLRSLREVRGKTVATVRGAQYDDRISTSKGFVLYPTDSYEQSLKMLLAGRVEMVVGPNLGLYFTARKMRIPKKALSKPLTLSVASGCVFVSRLTPESKTARITQAVERLIHNGTVKKLLDKYSL